MSPTPCNPHEAGRSGFLLAGCAGWSWSAAITSEKKHDSMTPVNNVPIMPALRVHFQNCRA